MLVDEPRTWQLGYAGCLGVGCVRVRQRSETGDRQRVLLVVQDTTAAAKVDQGFPASEQRDEWVGVGKVASDGWANGVDEGLRGSWLRERRGSKQPDWRLKYTLGVTPGLGGRARQGWGKLGKRQRRRQHSSPRAGLRRQEELGAIGEPSIALRQCAAGWGDRGVSRSWVSCWVEAGRGSNPMSVQGGGGWAESRVAAAWSCGEMLQCTNETNRVLAGMEPEPTREFGRAR